jgi:tetratricopeptide (TPR) repeat protein
MADQVEVSGRYTDYTRVSEEADQRRHVFHFCPDCGSTVFYTEQDAPEVVTVMVGAFADRSFPPPRRSGYGVRRHPWVVLPDGISHDEAWGPFNALYQAGEYAEAADQARDALAANPDNVQLLYNVACCESLAGRPEDAIEHLRRAVAIVPGHMRELAIADSDFDPIRDDPAFKELVGQD